MRVCRACGASIQHLGDRAVYCGSTCRANGAKRRSRAVPERPSEREPAPGPADGGGSVYEATMRDLVTAGRVDSVLGAYCLAMAARIDRKADTGSALAALCRQLEESMRDVAVRVPDIVDELRAQRAQRHAEGTGSRP
jgi:hypothetical protein